MHPHLFRPVIAGLLGTLLVGCQAGSVPIRPPGPGSLEIQLSDRGDSITVIGTDVSRGVVLEQLRTRHGIEVRASDVPDERISPHVVSAPLLEGVSRLLPEGARYVLRVGDRELAVILGNTREKVGPRDIRLDSLPTKDKTQPLPPTDRTTLKRPSDERSQLDPRTGSRRKPAPDSTLRIPPGSGPKLQAPVRVRESSLRLSFVITSSPDSIRLARAQLVPGATPTTHQVQGPLLFAVRTADGRLLHFGALLDPLEQHSYLEDGTHDVGRAREGSFGIWLPAEVLRRADGGGITLEFFDAREVTLPPVLDEKVFERSAERARRLARFDWPNIRVLLRERREQ